MEVHHHSHTSRKKWTHYFWEFLMLFLAVFLGFMAENQREHYIENKREKQFISSMVNDLVSDTVQLNEIVQRTTDNLIFSDSTLFALISAEIKNNSNKAHEFWESSSGFADFYTNDRTIQQLKSGGNMRIIHSKRVSDSIMDYYKHVQNLDEFEALLDQFNLKNFDIKYRLFATGFLTKEKAINKPVPLLSSDQHLLEEAYGYKLDYKNLLLILIKKDMLIKNKAQNLINLISEEYHLK